MIIPNIAFSQPENSKQRIEIIDLSELQRRAQALDHDPDQPHRVEFYLLIMIEKGRGKHFIDFEHHPFRDHSFIVINQHQIHAFDFSHAVSGKVVLFTEEFLDQVQMNMRIPMFSMFYLSLNWQPVFTPKPDLYRRSQQQINEVVQELQRDDHQEMIVMLLFSALLLMIMREKEESNSASMGVRPLRTFQQFGELLKSQFTITRDAHDYAKQLNITYKTLNQACKKVSQRTAKQVIDHFTMLEAKRRLVLNDDSVQQTAYDLGFEEPSNFVKYFKKHALITPSQFKKKAKS